MKKFSLALLIIFWTNISFAEVVDLSCVFKDRKFYVGLDFKNSKWLKENGSGTYMYATKEIIHTVKRNRGDSDITHYLWSLSRITGVGEIKGYKLTEEEINLVDQKQLDDIFKKGIGDLNKKSLTPARNNSFAKTFTEFLLNRSSISLSSEFECEKAEKKYKF